jgi:hypothetical protein
MLYLIKMATSIFEFCVQMYKQKEKYLAIAACKGLKATPTELLNLTPYPPV